MTEGERGNEGEGVRVPACAGMTEEERGNDGEGVRVPACAEMTEEEAGMTGGARGLRMLRVCALGMVLGRWLLGRWSGRRGWLGVGCRLFCGVTRRMRGG